MFWMEHRKVLISGYVCLPFFYACIKLDFNLGTVAIIGSRVLDVLYFKEFY